MCCRLHRRLFLLLLITWCLVPAPGLAAPLPPAVQWPALPNGAALVTQEWSGPEIGDQVLVAIAFRGGVYEEAPDQRGITRWLSEALSAQVRGQLQVPGDPPPPVTAELDLEYFALQLALPVERFPVAWPVILNGIKDRRKTWTNYAPSAQYLAEELIPLMEDGAFMGDLLLRTLIYANGPMVNPPLGTPPTLQSLQPQHLESWGERLLQPDRCLMVVVHPPGVPLEGLHQALGDWRRAKQAPALPGITVFQPSYNLEALRPMATTVPRLTLGILGPSVRDPKHAPYLIAAAALGDAQSGRFRELVGSGTSKAIQLNWEISRHQDSSLTILHLAQDVDGDIFQLHRDAFALLESALLSGLTELEVSRAQGLLQSALMERQTDPVACLSWLTSWSLWEHPTAGRRLETRIAMATVEEVNAALREFFSPERIAAAGLSARLPEDYYFPSEDPFWGTFRRPPGAPLAPRDLLAP